MPDFEQLYERIEEQQGYFCAQQAMDAGFSQPLQAYYVKTGAWIRCTRGIFRYKFFPAARELEEFYISHLWSFNRQGFCEGVLSHGTALYLWELGTYSPRMIDLTVPKTFRRHSKPPVSMELHKSDLSQSDWQMLKGLRVTTPIKTIIDLLEDFHIGRSEVLQAFREAVDLRLLIRPSHLISQPKTEKQRALLIDALQAIGYKHIDEIRQSA